MRTPFIAGNWKMHKTVSQAVDLVDELKELVKGLQGVEIVVAPPFTALHPVAQRVKGSNIKLSAQDCFWEEEGAYTGEISPPMLADVGCSHCIVGHSERRHIFGEGSGDVAKKVCALLAHGISPIICVGETLDERERGDIIDVVGGQLQGSLERVSPTDMVRVAVAYEPVWAIGTGKTATPQQAQEMHAFIREWLGDRFGGNVASSVPILYGGSVKPENIQGLMAMDDIDGALVGGASLKASSFAQIVRGGKSR